MRAIFYNVIQAFFGYFGASRAIRKVLNKHIRADEASSVLDIGCGTGRYAGLFKESDYTGIDIDDVYLAYARKQHSFGKFIKMDAAKLDFPDNHFDYVFSVSTFHHLSDKQVNESLSEMKGVCRDGGSVYVIDNVYPPKINFIGYTLFKLDRGRHQRTFQEMEQLLKKHNFEVLDSNLQGGFPYRYAIFVYRKYSAS